MPTRPRRLSCRSAASEGASPCAARGLGLRACRVAPAGRAARLLIRPAPRRSCFNVVLGGAFSRRPDRAPAVALRRDVLRLGGCVAGAPGCHRELPATADPLVSRVCCCPAGRGHRTCDDSRARSPALARQSRRLRCARRLPDPDSRIAKSPRWPRAPGAPRPRVPPPNRRNPPSATVRRPADRGGSWRVASSRAASRSPRVPRRPVRRPFALRARVSPRWAGVTPV